ncbi:MAG: CoA transferase subunit A [Salinirussus sp.]
MSVVDMETAIGEAISDGQLVYPAGFTHLIPFAAGHELIRQDFSNLTVARATPGAMVDQLVAAGVASKVIFSYAGDGLRREIVEGDVEIEEYTHFGTVSRLAAGAYNLPFLPVRTFAGSDLPEYNDKIRFVESPYGDGEIPVVPPLEPDVAIVHTHRASPDGTGQVWGIVGEIVDAAYAAETVILTTEEIVDEDVVRSDPNRTVVPGSMVDYVVEEPYCCHPTYVQGVYDRDRAFFTEWGEIARSHDDVMDYLDEWVYSVDNRREYVEKLGAGKLMDLQPDTNFATPVDMGGYL